MPISIVGMVMMTEEKRGVLFSITPRKEGSGLVSDPGSISLFAHEQSVKGSIKLLTLEPIAKLTAKAATTERGPPKGLENGRFWRLEGRAPSRPREFCKSLLFINLIWIMFQHFF